MNYITRDFRRKLAEALTKADNEETVIIERREKRYLLTAIKGDKVKIDEEFIVRR